PVLHRPAVGIERGVAEARDALAPVLLPSGAAVEGTLGAARVVGHEGVVEIPAVVGLPQGVPVAARQHGLPRLLVVEVPAESGVRREVDGAAPLPERAHRPRSDRRAASRAGGPLSWRIFGVDDARI